MTDAAPEASAAPPRFMLDHREAKDRDTLKRLLLAQALYQHGLEHSRSPGALNKMIAIHSFHNALEVALRAIMFQYDVGGEHKAQDEFMAMIGEIDRFSLFQEHGKRVPYKSELRVLKSAA